MTEYLSNFAITTITQQLSAIATTVYVQDASEFPSVQFRIKIDDELMLVTAKSGNTFTVTRGVESTTAAIHYIGSRVTQVLTNQGLINFIGQYSGQGPQGAQGATGSGAQGAQGVQGTNGTIGSNGSPGAQGSQGATGPSDFSTAVILAPDSSTRNLITASTDACELQLKAAVGQTANLVEFITSGSATKLAVNPNGVLVSTVSNGTAPFTVTSSTKVTNLNADKLNSQSDTAFVTVATGTSSRNLIISSSASAIPLSVKGATSQTANLFEAFDVNSSSKYSISAGGNTTQSGNAVVTGNITTTAGTITGMLLRGTAQNATDKILILKGASAHSGNLTEWQNSSSTVLSAISSDGRLVIGSATNGAKIDVTGTDGTRFLNITDGYGTVYIQYGQVVAPSFYAAGTSLFGSLNVGLNADIKLTRNAAGVLQLTDGSTGNGSLICGAYSASTKALVLKGATSQTANMFEIQDAGGTSRCRFNLTSYQFDVGNITLDGANGNITLPSNGNIRADSFTAFTITNSTLTGNNASAVPVKIKGASSQSANLTEWQNNSGTALAWIDANWYLYLTGGLQLGGYKLNLSPTGDIDAINDGQLRLYTTHANGIVARSKTTIGNSNEVGAANVPLTIKGSASQTANLQNWLNSSATVLASVSAAGLMTQSKGEVASVYRTTLTSVTGVQQITHNLNVSSVCVCVYDNSGNQIIPDEVTLYSDNRVDVDLTSYGTFTGKVCVTG